MTTRVCYKCGDAKPLTEEYWHPRPKPRTDFQTPCRVCLKIGVRDWDRRLRREALAHYSDGKFCCACCGEQHYEFLVIDHLHGGGGKHRRALGGGNRIYRWLRKEGYPLGFRVLCYNCNASFGFWGFCPHKGTLPANRL